VICEIWCAGWLLDKRDINGIGLDTLSFDYGPSEDFPVHYLLLGADKWALENLCNLDKIPPEGGFMVVGPIKHEGGSGGPTRVYTFIFDEDDDD
jgi:kynurenine formamidase